MKGINNANKTFDAMTVVSNRSKLAQILSTDVKPRINKHTQDHQKRLTIIRLMLNANPKVSAKEIAEVLNITEVVAYTLRKKAKDTAEVILI